MKVTNQTVKMDTKYPPACSFYNNIVTFNEAKESKIACGESTSISSKDGSTYTGSMNSSVNVSLSLIVDAEKKFGKPKISGPSSGWFGVGFDADAMSDLPYTMIVTGSTVREQKLGNHAPGTQLKSTVKVLSNTVSNGLRTVTLSRSAKGATSDYYSFDVSKTTSINLIVAVGYSETYAYHKAKATSQIVLSGTSSHVCVCDGPKQGFYWTGGKWPAVTF